MNKTLWLVGKHRNNPDNEEWEFGGIFDSEEKALKACRNW